MSTYECQICGMSVNATYGKLEEDSKVQISACPNGHGKIKSPICCGKDMSCNID